MPKSFQLAIPIKPHLKRYLREFYAFPYELTQKDELGLFLYHILRRRRFRDRKYFSIDSCSESLEVNISSHYAIDRGCFLVNDYQTHLLNSYLEMMMMRHCILFIKASEMAGVSNYAAIYRWIDMYQLDEGNSSKDWYHRIKKKYYRHKKSQKV